MKPTAEDTIKKGTAHPNPGTDAGGEGGTSGSWGGGATEGTEETGKETPVKAPARKTAAIHPWRKYRGKVPRPQ